MKVKRESEVAQSCPTLSDPMDCSLPGSSIHGIFQARVLEWGPIGEAKNTKWAKKNESEAKSVVTLEKTEKRIELVYLVKVKVKSLSRVRLLVTPWTAAYQAPPSMGFSRQEYWSGVPLPSPKYTRYYIYKIDNS